MTCGNCARKVNDLAQAHPGVAWARADLATATLSVGWKPDSSRDLTGLSRRLTEAGYPTAPEPPSLHAKGLSRKPLEMRKVQFMTAAACTVPQVIIEWGLGSHLHPSPLLQYLGLGLATIAMAVSGTPFAKGAWRQARAGTMGMDALVTLGASTAYVSSVVSLLAGWPVHLYFMETAAILMFISGGHWLETRVGARAESALGALLKLAPEKARRVGTDGGESWVDVFGLLAGDLVRLSPGERVPADGLVQSGSSSFNESMLTGESAPVEKSSGSKLYAGTLNCDGSIVMRVTGTGSQTALARIIEVVRRAQGSRANIQRLADRISGIFVPVVVGVAVLTFLGWTLFPDTLSAWNGSISPWLWTRTLQPQGWMNGLIHAAAVLIIACPCAMGLATPAALMAASGAASRRGILIRDAIALEKAGAISTVVFDKTGTLTQGEPSVVETWLGEPGDPGDASNTRIRWAAALAQPSLHPLSQAISRLPSVPGPDPHRLPPSPSPWQGWKEHRGLGIEARWSGNPAELPHGTLCRLGSREWLASAGIETGAATPTLDRWSKAGTGVVGLAAEHKALAWFAIQDSLRPEAREVIAGLQNEGVNVLMLTGDQQGPATEIARQLGLIPSQVLAGVRPEGKSEALQTLQGQGHRVAFVGDGINDAPALAQADLGIAVGQASDIAQESADLILLRGDLHAIPESLSLARSTLRIIRQNLFWAFSYNVLAIPLAALGFMNPMLCALAMGVSDILVLGNSLRLLRWRGAPSRRTGRIWN